MGFDEPKSTDNAMHQVMHEARDYQRIEVITGRRRRRNWTDDERAQIVAESAVPGANISDVARRWGVHRGLLTVWRREAGVSGSAGGRRRVTPPQGPLQFVPITLTAAEAPLPAAVRRPEEPGSTACGRIELEIGGGRWSRPGPSTPLL